MNKMLLVMRQTIVCTVTRRSFLLVVLGLPVVAVIIMLAGSALNRTTPPTIATESVHANTAQTEGYVDHSGLIVALPADIPAGALTAYPDEVAARRALQAGDIAAYYVVPQDYISSGKLYYVHPRAGYETSTATSWLMRRVLLVNLLGGDTDLADWVWNPLQVKTTVLGSAQQAANDDEELSILPMGVAFLILILTIMASSLLRNSLGDEKKNRLVEVLLSSLHPRELMAGKIIGLGIVGLLQTLLWVVTGYFVLRASGRMFNLPTGTVVPPSLIAWAVVFFLLGYVVYGSLLAGLGVLTGPNSPGSSTADFIIVWPTMIPFWVWMFLEQSPHSPFAVVMSLFPLTAPGAMLMRQVVGGVPLWQPILAVILLAITAYFVIRAVARVFRAQVLLSGQTFTAKRYYGALLGRE